MTRSYFTTAILTLALIGAAPHALAQDDDMSDMQAMMEAAPTTLMSFWQCDIARLGEIAEGVNTYMKPAAEEMIDEGMLTNWGLMVHSWGDEWNVVFHSTGEDPAALIAANAELNDRTAARAEAAGEDMDLPAPVVRYCTAHKDNFYTNAAYVAN